MTVKVDVRAKPDFPLRVWISGIGAEVSVLEYDGRQLWLRWVEPGRCHYGEQRWSLAAAKRNGYCIVSGLPIRRGELVFRPGERPMPANAHRMILPEPVEQVLAGHTVTIS
ncbi:DUF3331 domain-containing protein [Paraburkholderia agricolaris]|uniref:DUF3331 domain-containing protein n=1 Tax=Paraburkholderia agricolaris TaxID=2152888 RepID=A0ABW8ZHX3_9BURK